ncbi:MAG: hypothetical protein EXR02_08055 [Rhodospirillales bacterium]|nr:hypothetical protein [Rhodospirillales bacterium]
MSEIIRTHGIKPKSVIINELFDAGVMGQRDDGIVIYHPVIQAMMLPDNANPDPEEYGKPEGQPVLLFGKERLKDAPGRVNARTRRVI